MTIVWKKPCLQLKWLTFNLAIFMSLKPPPNIPRIRYSQGCEQVCKSGGYLNEFLNPQTLCEVVILNFSVLKL